MKIYLFNPETGVYQGEDYCDSGSMKSEDQSLPPGCTNVEPPAYHPGEVPVFQVPEKRWEILPGPPPGRED